MNATPQERLALGALALLLAAGGVARAVRGGPAPPEWVGGGAGDGDAPAALVAAVTDSTARAAARARPLAPGERLDPNTAPADDLVRLPGVGPSLAARIVERRGARGRRYRTLADLDSVPGVGPALLAKLAPHLALAPAPALVRARRGTAATPSVPREGAVVELNRATAAELEALPGIGPSLAARIVESRARQGRFRSVDDLERVPGIGPATRVRLQGRVRVTP